MNKKLLSYLVAGALATTLALASPALARGGGGGGGHGGGFGGGHYGGMGGGGHYAAARWGGTHWSGMNRGMRFAHAGISPRFSRFAFHHRFHHRFNRFAFYGDYAAYDSCWSRVWTSYGPQWVNVCGYGYY